METAIRRLRSGRSLRASAGLIFILLQGWPVATGLIFLLLPAFGYFPVLGATDFGLLTWREALLEPGLAGSLAATLCAGALGSLLAFVLSLALAARWAPSGEIWFPTRTGFQAFLQAVIATPPVALAIGIGFVIAPSGWLMRLIQAVIPSGDPPDYLAPHDPWGLSLMLAIVLKETPFLTIAALAALRQIQVRQMTALAAGLGYSPAAAWAKIVLPDLILRLRWPFFAVLTFALSTVDMAMILGPVAPSTLPVVIADIARDPELQRRLPAAALAIIQAGIVLCSWLCCMAIAKLAMRCFLRPWRIGGTRELPQAGLFWARLFTDAASLLGAGIIVLSLLGLALWSLAPTWPYPEPWPQCCALSNWRRALAGAGGPFVNSMGLAVGSSVISLIAAIGYLSWEGAWRRQVRLWSWRSAFFPLIAPDICFLLGLQIFFLSLGWRTGLAPVLWSHVLFVFPYVLLTIADPWRRLDPRYERIAASLGATPWVRLFAVRLALLRPNLALGLGLGVAVSLSLYLPTVLLGGGRVETLASEAVALSAGGDRRVVGVYAVAQTTIAWASLAFPLLLARRHWWRANPA